MITLVDTHCHIHSVDYPLSQEEVATTAAQAGVQQFVCVGTDVADSHVAVRFAQKRPNHWASIGVHPNDQAVDEAAIASLRQLATQAKVVAVGECGLDYFYQHQPPQIQQAGLRAQLQIAIENDLPLIFHVRDAFADFWPIFDEYDRQAAARGQRLRGVLHSFTDTQEQADQGLGRGLYIGVNGIMTFTKNDWQLDIARHLPLNKMILETDAPYLTPVPYRGKVNKPANVRLVAEFLADLRHESLESLASATTRNAHSLFSFLT